MAGRTECNARYLNKQQTKQKDTALQSTDKPHRVQRKVLKQKQTTKQTNTAPQSTGKPHGVQRKVLKQANEQTQLPNLRANRKECNVKCLNKQTNERTNKQTQLPNLRKSRSE